MNKQLFNNSNNYPGIYRALLIDYNGELRIHIPGLSSYKLDLNNLEKYKDILPKPIWNVPNLEAQKHETPIHPCWVTFENGDVRRPIIMGWLGKGIMYSVGDFEGNSSKGNSNNSNYNESIDYISESNNGNIKYNKWCYPLIKKHSQNPLTDGRRFGSSRSNGTRSHAGTDLTNSNGTDIVACTDGIVMDYNIGFYSKGSDALLVKNNDGSCIVYGEMTSKLRSGSKISKGQIIGQIAITGMLHFEAYAGDETGHLLVNNGEYKYVKKGTYGDYKRRRDLCDSSFVINLPLYK